MCCKLVRLVEFQWTDESFGGVLQERRAECRRGVALPARSARL